MSFWKNLFGSPKKETQIIEEPEHDVSVAPPDDLMVVKDKEDKSSNISSPRQVNNDNNNLDYKKENLNNKESP